ncbi:MAG: OmpA family protein [Bacteroidetes bacterium]|nr:OmpA family protein [Bacteroidota bacterium]
MRISPFFTLTILLYFSAVSAFSQIESFFRFGIGAEVGLNSHSSQFAQIPGFAAIPVDLSGGSGFGYSFGISSDVLLGHAFRAGLYAGYDAGGATLSGDESTVFTVNGIAVAGTIRHFLSAKLPAAIVRPSLIFGIGNCEISGGLTVMQAIEPDFEIRQEVVEPQGITLTSKPFGGSLPSGGITVAPFFSAGLRYSWGNFIMLPAIRAEFGVSDIAGLPWRSFAIRTGISALFAPVPPNIAEPVIVPPDTIYRRDTIAVEIRGIPRERIIPASKNLKHETFGGQAVVIVSESYRREIPRAVPLLRAQARVAFIRADGTQSERLHIETRRIITKRFFPVLPIVFFETGSADIPLRYFESTPENPLARYYRSLDTIAARLAAMPNETLVLTALLRGDSLDSMRKMRAERLRKILLKQAEIRNEQIRIRTEAARPVSGLPLDETECVNMTASEAAILAPQIFYDTTTSADPPEARFFPNIVSDEGVASWRLQISADGKTVKEFSGNDEPPLAIAWRLADEKTVLRIRKPLSYRLTATNYSGDTVVSPAGEIHFIADTATNFTDVEMFDAIEYSIVFFDYNSSDISARDRIALEHLTPYCIADKTEVFGMTDSSGNAQYNRRLSRKRAESAAKILGLSSAAARGIGAESSEFPDNLPEGRMFNRRVKVSAQR